MDIKDLLKEKKQYVGKEIEICGWIKNHRPQKEFGSYHFLMVLLKVEFK